MSTNGTKRAVPDTRDFDANSLLRRADRAWTNRTADDPAPPEYLAHLAQYLRQHLTGDTALDPAPAEPTPVVDDRELVALREQVTAAEQNAAGRRAEADQLRAENTDLRGQLVNANEAFNELAKVRRQNDALNAHLAEANDDNASLADQAADLEQLRANAEAATKLIGTLRADYDTVQAERDRLADELAAATVHVCTYPWPDPYGPVEPCSCGRSFPRYVVPEVDDIEDVEPWDDLFDRIRAEIEDLP